MQQYSNSITLIKNSRGIYDLDTSKGCFSGMQNNSKGCYSECYAARQSLQYGYDFSKTVYRKFENIEHLISIRKQLFNDDIKFIRIGVTGDPSENWTHTLSIINLIYGIKPIVVITKHWNTLTYSQLIELSKYDICINTSISALDTTEQIKHRLKEYNRLKQYSKSVLRIVSCDFNTNNLEGLFLNEIQNKLFENENVLDNVLRVSQYNELVKMKIINIKSKKFLTTKKYFSQLNKKTFTGDCSNCSEMCGLNI